MDSTPLPADTSRGMGFAAGRRDGRASRREWVVWVACLGLVPLLALGGAYLLVNARNGGPSSTSSDLAVQFLTSWATPICGVLVGWARGLRWPKLLLIAILGVGAVLAWFYIVFVILVAAGVWVYPVPD